MSATRTSSAASNYACDTLLTKQNDSTTGIPNVSGSTGLNSASYFVVNAGSDTAPIIQGIVTMDAAPIVPAGLLQGTLAVNAQAAGTSATISQIFPDDANGTYMLTFTCSSPGQGINLSSVGRVVKSGATIVECIGFSGYAVQAALAGGAVSLIAFQNIVGSPSVVQLRNDANVPITGTINLYKIASAN